MISAERIKRLAPRARADIVDAIVDNWDYAEAKGITTPLRVAHFMAQIAHESTGLTRTEESLTYTRAERIRQVWPTRFKTVAAAQPYVRNPQALAEKVYGGRKDLGNTKKGDGWRYRGGGLIQVTGRANHRQFGYEDRPEALREPATGFRAAVDYWASRNCNAAADRDDLTAVRRLINGGTIGLDDVRSYLRKAKDIFAEPLADTAPPRPREDKPARPRPTREQIESAQARLRELGYHEVGEVDGKWGRRSRDAMNAFKADNDLPLVQAIDAGASLDAETLVALSRAQPREEAPARAEATAEDLAPKSKTVTMGLRNKVVAMFGAVWSFILAAISGAMEYFQEAYDKLAPVKNALGAIPLWAWLLGAGSLALILWWQNRQVVDRVVADYRQGKKL